MTAMAAKRPVGWAVSDAYGEMAARLEGGQDLRGEVVPLHQFMEDPGWADLPLRPRQRLFLKVADNAINKRELAAALCQVPLRDRQDINTEDDALVAARTAIAMPHACWYDEDLACFVYDEAEDWAYLLAADNRYARVLANYDPANRAEPLTLVFVCGRGSSKTTYLSAGISAWFTYRILSAPSPHGMFGLAPTKPLRIQNVATSVTQAGEFSDSYKTIMERVAWFEGKHAPPGASLIKFPPHLYIEKTSSNSRSGRGRDTVGYIHDEIAFADKTAGPRSDRKLYDAIRAAVKTRAKGKGLVVVVSSPAEADGVLFELFTKAEAGTLPNSIVFQLATWEMIPGQSKDDYAAEYRADEDVADMEYGAQFYTGASNLLPNVWERFPVMTRLYERLVGATAAALWRPMEHPDEDKAYVRRQRRFSRVLHVDTSEGGDRTVVVMAHVRDRHVVIELVRAWDREVSYSRELYPFILELRKRFPIDIVTFDQADSIQLIQDLNDQGMTAMKTAFTAKYNDEIARNFRTVVQEGILALYPVDKTFVAGLDRVLDKREWADDPDLWPAVSMAILWREMAAAKKVIKGNLIAAEAPTAGAVKTDDALDAAMAAVYQAMMAAGGLGVFFDLPRAPEGVKRDKVGPNGEVIPGDPQPHPEAPAKSTFRDILCPHHRGWVRVDTGGPDKILPCPDCKAPIQVRL